MLALLPLSLSLPCPHQHTNFSVIMVTGTPPLHLTLLSSKVQHSLLESPRSQRKQLKKDAEMLDMEIADLMEEKEVLTPR